MIIASLFFSSFNYIFADVSYDYTTLGRYVYEIKSSVYPNNIMPQLWLAAYYDITGHYKTSYPYLEASNIVDAANIVFCRGTDNVFYLYAPDPNTLLLGLRVSTSAPSTIQITNRSDSLSACRRFSYNLSTNQYSSTQVTSLTPNAGLLENTAIYCSEDITYSDGTPLFTEIINNNEFPSVTDLTGYTGAPSGVVAPLTVAITKTVASKLNNEYPSKVPSGGATDKLYYTDYETGALWELLQINTGIIETYLSHSQLYFANLSGNLATFANNQKTIEQYMSGLIPSVEGIEEQLSSLNSSVDALNTKVNNAFPQDEIGINTAVAQTVLDDTEGTGLTASKVAQSKFALDDNASIFQIDTTGGQYTTPADAITHGDWSFWSQTTVDNLGSEYTFSIDSLDAELMDDNDIYDENISALRRLIGW